MQGPRIRVTWAAAAVFVTALVLYSASAASAENTRWDFNVEMGAAWQQRNDVRIPGDRGTRFSLADLTGQGPFPFYRLQLTYDVAPRQQLRVLIAPFGYEERGVLKDDVFFVDKTFSAGRATRATYQFNSYRLTYRYLFYDARRWRWWVGGTAKMRDAEVALRQNGITSSKTDVGFVPLLNLYGDYRFAGRWHFIVDFDGLAAPQGRALDLGLKVHYDLSDESYLGGGYRSLEGGVDNDAVFNFAWYNYAFVSAGYRF